MPVQYCLVMMKPRPISWRGTPFWPDFAGRPTPWNLHGTEAVNPWRLTTTKL